MEIKSFTFASEDIMRDLPCDVSVMPAQITNPEGGIKPLSARAIWDTGASGSAITANVAKSLGLEPISMVDVHTAAGIRPSNVYMIDLMLPNEILVHNVQVTEADMSTADVLIGMDVITLGDFALTNLGGKTRFTFSVPSPRSIDFVQEGQAILKRAEQHGSAHSKSQLKIQRKKERKNKKQGHKA